MSSLMIWLFWWSLALVAYVYAGYPLLLRLWRALRPRGIRTAAAGDNLPGVSIVIAARNEGHSLGARIENLLSLDYPAERLQIVVVSDGSTDGTGAVLDRYRRSVDGVAIPAGGKARALNAAVARARHDLLVFADARQAFAPDALRELVAPFHDPGVGVVTGELLLNGEARDRRTESRDRRSDDLPALAADRERRDGGPARRRRMTSTIADGIGLYWRYEKSLRRDESAIHSTLGATGAIYALRRSLWTPLPPDTILDDVLAPMRAVLAGCRCVFNDRARAFDRPSADARAEGRRKVRTLAGNYQLLWLEPRLLLPWRNPVWLQLVSHKVGRLLVPYALLALLVSSAALAGHASFYAAAFAGQCLFYVLAGYGAWLDRRHRPGVNPMRPSPSPSRAPSGDGGAGWRERGLLFPRGVDRFARIALTFLVLNISAVAGLGTLLFGRKVWR